MLRVADGGMATSLYDKGFYINRSFEELSVTQPEAVKEVTTAFQKAGAEFLTTNTFGATRPKLTEYGLQDNLREIIQASVKITREVAESARATGAEAQVLGAIGPLGVLIEPLGPTSFTEAVEFYREMAEALESGRAETGRGDTGRGESGPAEIHGVDGFTLLGFSDLNELKAAIEGVRSVSAKPIHSHISIQESMRTSLGHSLQDYVNLAHELDVEVIGLSGEVGPSGMLTAIEKLRPLTKKPISILPNAGLPRYVNDQYIYLCSPDYMGKFAKRFAQAGANIIGGHSGVHEPHIRAVTNALRMLKGLSAGAGVESGVGLGVGDRSEANGSGNGGELQEISGRWVLQDLTQAAEPKPLAERSLLGKKLAAGEPVVSVEIVPPRGVDCRKFLKHCETLQAGGVEFVNIPDGARAVARMSSLQLSSYIRQHFSIEPIPHFTSRDRNLIGLQSDLLGAYVNGVRNVLLVTGDPPKLGNTPGASGVYDVDAIGLTHIAVRMNRGLDLGGSSFGQPTEFMVGVALNPTARNQELEISRFRYKIEAGADYAITQPIYDVEAYKRFFEAMGPVEIPIIMGIWPLVSLRNAEFLKNEVPGVEVPDWAVAEMEKAGDNKEEAVKRGLEIAFKTIDQARGLVAGFQVSAPFNRVEVALEVVNAFRS